MDEVKLTPTDGPRAVREVPRGMYRVVSSRPGMDGTPLPPKAFCARPYREAMAIFATVLASGAYTPWSGLRVRVVSEMQWAAIRSGYAREVAAQQLAAAGTAGGVW